MPFKTGVANTGGGGSSTSPTQTHLFNPDATAVLNDTYTMTLSVDNSIAFVTINGQVISTSEYTLTGTSLVVTPDNGFNYIDDEILIYQNI